MFGTSGTRRLVFTALCILIFTGFAHVSGRAQCETVTDAKIVSNIYGMIKADKGLAAQIPHINVQSTTLAVKYQGWVGRKAEYDKVVGFAMKMACVKMVNVNGFASSAPSGDATQRIASGCGAGMKQCGDICIPDTDVCNITSFLGLVDVRFTFETGYAINSFDDLGCSVY